VSEKVGRQKWCRLLYPTPLWEPTAKLLHMWGGLSVSAHRLKNTIRHLP